MKWRLSAFLIGLGVAAVFLATTVGGQAKLGEMENSVDADETALSATGTSTTNHAGYRVRELRSDSIVLREYVSPTGTIFAITWTGLAHPDLTALLGSSAGEYQTALRNESRKHGRRRQRVETNRVVVEKWGHMRNLQGRAYLPALLPSGVSIDEIK